MGKPAKKPDEVKEGLPGWMGTYADLVTLLMAFFVMLMAMANFEDTQRVEAVLSSIKDALGVAGFDSSVVLTSEEVAFTEDVHRQEAIQPVVAKLRDAMSERVSDDFIRMIQEEQDLRVRLEERVFFKPGSYTLHPSAFALLSDVADAIKEAKVQVRVEGHADGSGSEQENWELSARRAVAVVMALRTKGPIDGKRLEAVAFGSFHPGSSIGENSAWSRRIELVLSSDDPGGAAAAGAIMEGRRSSGGR